MIHKSFTKKEILDLINTYEIPIEDAKDLSKGDLSNALIISLETYEISWNSEYPEFYKNDDLLKYLSEHKSNEELNYKEKSEMIQKAKKLMNYARNGYMLSFTDYLSHDKIYQDGLIVANHGDIPTCRRAIEELNKDPKIRNKIEVKISPKMKKTLEQKKISKEELNPKFKFRRGHYEINFD